MPDKMCCRFLGFVLLIWFHGVLKVQSQEEPCDAPTLVGGYFAPSQVTYTHGSDLTYACDDGRKPAVEGWWATSSCQNGKWSPEPQCIDETSCLPLNIPNAKYTENSKGWYEETEIIRITCDKGYVSKNQDATAECKNGTWTSVPVCEKSRHACAAPPKILHALITHQKYQDLFAEYSKVSYECKDGYTVDGGEDREILHFCVAGNWTTGHECRVSTGSGSDSSVNRPVFTVLIGQCGETPRVPNGDVVTTGTKSLTYQCNEYYKLEGPAEVFCYSDGTWSQPPTCRAAFCTVDTSRFPELQQLTQRKYIKEGVTETFNCIYRDYWERPFTADVQCRNRQIIQKPCCSVYNRENNRC